MYCTVDEVVSMLKEDMLNVIIGDEYIEDKDEKTKRISELALEAVEDACSEIDGYLSGRYDVPFDKTPTMLKKLAKDIAVYNLVSRAGIDEGEREKTFLNRYNQAIKFLTSVAEGKINIGVPDKNTSTAAGVGFQIDSSPRIFSRKKLRGW